MMADTNRPIGNQCDAPNIHRSRCFDFKVGYLNIQGLKNKELILSKYGLENQLGIICISEHWANVYELPNYKIEHYSLVNSYCRNSHIRGGVAIYISSLLNYSVSKLNFDTLCDELNFEATGIIIKCLKLAVVSLYRSPTGVAVYF